jgi:hypothetical protein
MILGLDVEGASKAFPLNALRKTRVVHDTLGGSPILDRPSTGLRYDDGILGALERKHTEHSLPQIRKQLS